MRHILILTAAYGEGHNAAARGLEEALAGREGVSVRVWDPLRDALGWFYDTTRRDYLRTIEHRPRLWSFTYWLLDVTPLVHLAAWLLFGVRRLLRQTIAAEAPEVIVCVHPVYPYLLRQLYGAPAPFRLGTVVTDSITINSAWHRCRSDWFVVPNEDSAEAMRTAGVPPELIRVLGFPVTPRFAREPVARPEPAPGATRVLYMINAGGAQSLAILQALLQVATVEFTVTAGRDEALARTIQELARAAGRSVEVLGWVKNMPELVMSHHVLIGKAGGASVQEAIAARTPMIITKVVPGQEEGNAILLEQNGCGAVRETPAAIAAQVEALFADGAALWKKWESNLARLSRPDAALRLADAILAEPAP